MKAFRRYVIKPKQILPTLVGLLFLAGNPSLVKATTCQDVCNFPGNSCVADTVNVNVSTPVANLSVIDCTTFGFPKVQVNDHGSLNLQGVQRSRSQCAAFTALLDAQSAVMTIVAGDVRIKSGGVISGDNNLAGSLNSNGGAIFIDLHDPPAGTTGSLIIDAGGELTSDSVSPAKGRGGIITVAAKGKILVDENQGVRGLISADSFVESRQAFLDGCGRAQISLLAEGASFENVPWNSDVPNPQPTASAIEIRGTVQNIPGPKESVVGGKIYLMAGKDGGIGNLTNVPPFPNPGPLKRSNPPTDNTTVYITKTGLVNVLCRDDGGCDIHIFACVVLIEGLVDVGSPATIVGGIPFPGLDTSREQRLPVFAEIVANEDIILQGGADYGGRIHADLREGFLRHRGQYDPTDPTATPCAFNELSPPTANGPLTNARGGADVCLIARRFIGLNGDAPFYTLNDPDPNAHRFIVRASINEQFNTQKGGNVLVWQTADNQKGIELLGRVIDASAPRAGSIGGVVEIQSAEKVDINGWGSAPTVTGRLAAAAVKVVRFRSSSQR